MVVISIYTNDVMNTYYVENNLKYVKDDIINYLRDNNIKHVTIDQMDKIETKYAIISLYEFNTTFDDIREEIYSKL